MLPDVTSCLNTLSIQTVTNPVPNTPVQSITWIDMHDFINGSKEKRYATAMKFGKALAEIGFVGVLNSGINKATIDRAYSIAEQYFALPEEIKMQKKAPDGLNGFLPFGTESARDNDTIDLKEFFQTTGATHPEELWPDFPNFKDAMKGLYVELETCVKHCLQATAIYLGYIGEQDSILSDMIGTGNALMRILHYPPVDPASCPPGAVRSAPHEDICMMTVIPRATAKGLQVKNSAGEWIEVVLPEGAAIINSGDALKHITNKMIPSTTHQVVNPLVYENTHRYSVPFFGQPAASAIMEVLDRCKGTTAEKDLPVKITWGEMLQTRLNEIYKNKKKVQN